MEIQRDFANACSARVSGKRDNGKREYAVFFMYKSIRLKLCKKRKETGMETYTYVCTVAGEGKSDATCENKRN